MVLKKLLKIKYSESLELRNVKIKNNNPIVIINGCTNTNYILTIVNNSIVTLFCRPLCLQICVLSTIKSTKLILYGQLYSRMRKIVLFYTW